MKKITHVNQIPQIKYPNYTVNWPVAYLPNKIEEWKIDYHLDLNPEFQRGHVWTAEQKVAYVEFLFRGGRTPSPILFNCPNWTSHTDKDMPMVVLDGLQRITAIQEFYGGKFKIFDSYVHEIEGANRMGLLMLEVGVYDFKTLKEVLEIYLAMNSYGTPHSPEEIARVRRIYEKA